MTIANGPLLQPYDGRRGRFLAHPEEIDRGMQPNSSGRPVHYLEIYEPDVLADDMQSLFQYAAIQIASSAQWLYSGMMTTSPRGMALSVPRSMLRWAITRSGGVCVSHWDRERSW